MQPGTNQHSPALRRADSERCAALHSLAYIGTSKKLLGSPIRRAGPQYRALQKGCIFNSGELAIGGSIRLSLWAAPSPDHQTRSWISRPDRRDSGRGPSRRMGGLVFWKDAIQ